jgi:hypothetical protein
MSASLSPALDACMEDLQEFGCNSKLLSSSTGYKTYQLKPIQVASVDLLAYIARKLERQNLQLQLENKTLQIELPGTKEDLGEVQKNSGPIHR